MSSPSGIAAVLWYQLQFTVLSIPEMEKIVNESKAEVEQYKLELETAKKGWIDETKKVESKQVEMNLSHLMKWP